MRKLRSIGWRLHRMLHATTTVRTAQGTYTVLTRDLGVGRPLYVERQFERDFSERALGVLAAEGLLPARGVTMLDVGANIGVIAIGLLRSGRIEQAVAIEPDPTNYELLVRNIERNGLAGRVHPVQCALGEAYGSVGFELSADNMGDHRVRSATPLGARERFGEAQRPTISVTSVPLDELYDRHVPASFPPPSLMWIDVQGHEGFVFRGGEATLGSGLPTVSEVWPYGILRAGMTLDEFTGVAASYWSHVWVDRGTGLGAQPIAALGPYLDELGVDGAWGNVIFGRR